MVPSEAGRFRVLVLIALVAGLRVWWAAGDAPEAVRAHTARIACTVLDIGQSDADRASFTCAADAGPVLAVGGIGPAPRVGERLLLRGRLEPFDPPRNPGEPDERAIQRERGVVAAMSGARVLAHLPPGPQTLAIRIALLHAWALAQLRLRLPEPFAEILAGELWGERGSLPPDLRAEFQETGTVHILVTAGLHLGVVAMVAMWLLRLCRAPRIAACTCCVTVVWVYAFISGLHLPSIRAAIMISTGLAAHAAGAASRAWTPYACAMLGIALFFPSGVTSVSFALSFTCVGAILLLAGELQELLGGLALPAAVRETLSLTLATQFGTWPLTARVFLLFSPYAFAANVLVVPIVGFTMMLGAAQLVLTPLTPLAQSAANLNAWFLAWIVAAIQVIAALPGAAVPMTPPGVWAIVLYDACLAAGVYMWKRAGRTPAIVLLCIAVQACIMPPLFPDRHLRITVLDVGQADCIVVQTPNGHTILVDAGGRLERGAGANSTAEQVGARVVVPFLRRAGVRHIDALVLSHPHGDHVGGFAPIMRDGFAVTEFADSGQQYGGYAYRDAVRTARAERIPIVYPRAGMVWRTDDGVTLTFIGPSLPFIESNNTINDNSVAFILQYKHFRMLFTGDAGVAAEQRFINEGIDLRATVLKVGHHGSAYSSSPAFIAAVHPQYAIISVGRHNMFGHPAPSTVKTLQRYGARVYRTDENGATTVTADDHSVVIMTLL